MNEQRYAVFDGEVAFAIDSDVRIPRPKIHLERERMQRNVFKAYADAYEACHVRRPVLLLVSASGYFKIDVMGQRVTAKRLKELTRMLKERVKDR